MRKKPMVIAEVVYLVEWFPPDSDSCLRTFKILEDAAMFANEIVDLDVFGEVNIDEVVTVSFPNGQKTNVLCREWLQSEDGFERI